MAPVKVSVLMPVYNGQQFVADAIESILAQTMPDFEFIIVDDGSQDSSWSIIQSYEDKRIRAYQRPHQGIVSALKFGISVAQSDWIARMDADDISLPDRFERQLAAVWGDDEVVVLGGANIAINKNGKRLGMTKVSEAHEEILENVLYGRGYGIDHSSVFMRTEALHKIGGYRARFLCSEDIDLWLRMSEVGTLRSLPEVINLNRLHSENISLSDSGCTQVLNALAARVCYFKRKAGKDDPANLDDIEWAACIKEIERVCEHYGVFRARTARQKISIYLQSVSGKRFLKWRKTLRLASLLFSDPMLLIYGLSLRPWRRTLRHLERSI